MLDTGEKAPSFSLSDQNGRVHSLDMYTGKWVVLYFYPKDDTPGCTKEACGFRDMQKEFEAHNAVILGMSGDSEESHLAFTQKYALPFHLLADTQKKVVEQYGVWVEKNMYGKKYMGIARTTFLLNPRGIIVKIYKNVKVEEHSSKVLEDIKSFGKEDYVKS